MAYLLHYKIRFERNEGTEKEPTIVECFHKCAVMATDADYDTQMAFAKKEAYNGEVTVEENVPEAPVSQAERITALEEQLAAYEAAYQQGVNEA